MQELNTNSVTTYSGWDCAAICAGVCWMPCAAGASTGAAALAVVSGSFYYANYKNN